MSERQGRVVALSVSDRKGTPKCNVPVVRLVEDWGIDGDAHAGRWHRQVSLLALESVRKMQDKGADVAPGVFAENITTEHVDLVRLHVGDRLTVGVAEVEITQIGKECHAHCAIFHQVGDCVMPREGVFARVIRGGEVRVGDPIRVLTAAHQQGSHAEVP
jgi:molybdopterin adenylyltransferase